MNRARLIGLLLGLIVLICVGVIYADQKGMLGGQTASAPLNVPNEPAQAPGLTPHPQAVP